ncbi:hypothetical protein G6L94_32745 [Agrobacterium rhizogenes]|uniref:hypothetical protein n=1 Tax=Rhizobium rhizogenes TaxID=359 RepID=UPI0011477A45|nr:hypothetical protein [Rhizobium rhizogenes]NTI46658.1 hypothetical protein [Rhizobium rhizogenes]NTI53083.1 hypothetical protein [Rhizobium rhizogenes]NTI98456.1 hypothetical protein [Rhizobium rhizogenes]NTJ60884.1 hypothetical protein [Rhizobium rhizogenes]
MDIGTAREAAAIDTNVGSFAEAAAGFSHTEIALLKSSIRSQLLRDGDARCALMSKVHKRSVFSDVSFLRYLPNLVYTICFLVVCAQSALAETEFDRQCRRLLPLADDFAKKCLKDAVPFSRMFHPSGGTRAEPEAFRILFSDAYADSHFILGCHLGARGNLTYVGLYYKTSTDPLPAFRSDQIGFVDFNANAGIRVNGRKQILIAVRQFVTDFIPQRYEARVRNCEDGDLEGVQPSADSTTLVRNPDDDKEWIYRYRPSTKAEIKPYDVFFGPGDAPRIWQVVGDVVIDANGALLTPSNWRQTACSKWQDVYGEEGIVQETCNMNPDEPRPVSKR